MKHYRDFTTAEKCILAAQEINRLQMILDALRPHWSDAPGSTLLEIERLQTNLSCIEQYYEQLKHMPEEDDQ